MAVSGSIADCHSLEAPKYNTFHLFNWLLSSAVLHLLINATITGCTLLEVSVHSCETKSSTVVVKRYELGPSYLDLVNLTFSFLRLPLSSYILVTK